MRAIHILSAVLAIGVASAVAGAAASPFAGRWSGPWSVRSMRQSGRFTLDVSAAGKVTGAVTNGAKIGTVRGTIDGEGHLDASYSYGGAFTYSARATMSRAGDHLRGTIRYASPGGEDLGSSDLDLRLGDEAMPSEPISAPPSPPAVSSRS